MIESELEKDLANVSIVDEEELAARHKKERKDLQAKIQALKKTAGKKNKKEVQEEIVRLENDLDRRQEAEVAAASKKQTKSPEQDSNRNGIDAESNHIEEKGQRVSKAQKRRDKKAAQEKDREAEYAAQAELNKSGPRAIEMNKLRELLAKRQLVLHPISSDGNCLYNAIRHQLDVTGRVVDDISTLRNKTADYIMQNKDSLIFYMTNPDTGDCLSDAEFERYCNDLRNTPAWGGQIEINALSQILKAPIEVIQSDGPPTVQGDNEFKGPNLIITYHRHMYSLGEHYNATRPTADQAGEESD